MVRPYPLLDPYPFPLAGSKYVVTNLLKTRKNRQISFKSENIGYVIFLKVGSLPIAVGPLSHFELVTCLLGKQCSGTYFLNYQSVGKETVLAEVSSVVPFSKGKVIIFTNSERNQALFSSSIGFVPTASL